MEPAGLHELLDLAQLVFTVLFTVTGFTLFVEIQEKLAAQLMELAGLHGLLILEAAGFKQGLLEMDYILSGAQMEKSQPHPTEQLGL